MLDHAVLLEDLVEDVERPAASGVEVLEKSVRLFWETWGRPLSSRLVSV